MTKQEFNPTNIDTAEITSASIEELMNARTESQEVAIEYTHEASSEISDNLEWMYEPYGTPISRGVFEKYAENDADVHKRFQDAEANIVGAIEVAKASKKSTELFATGSIQHTEAEYKQWLKDEEASLRKSIETLYADFKRNVEHVNWEKTLSIEKDELRIAKEEVLQGSNIRATANVQRGIDSGKKEQQEHEKRRNALIENIDRLSFEYRQLQADLARNNDELREYKEIMTLNEINQPEILDMATKLAEEERKERFKLSEEYVREWLNNFTFQIAQPGTEKKEDELYESELPENYREYIANIRNDEKVMSDELRLILDKKELNDKKLDHNEKTIKRNTRLAKEAMLTLINIGARIDEIEKLIDSDREKLHAELRDASARLTRFSGEAIKVTSDFGSINRGNTTMDPADIDPALRPVLASKKATQNTEAALPDPKEWAHSDYNTSFILESGIEAQVSDFKPDMESAQKIDTAKQDLEMIGSLRLTKRLKRGLSMAGAVIKLKNVDTTTKD